VLKGRTPLGALQDWRREKPELFKKRSSNHTGFDTWCACRVALIGA
jgi:hypothetical protein